MRIRNRATPHADRVLEVSRRRYERGRRQAPHAHDYDGITLVVGGSLVETVAESVVSASALSVVFKPAGVLHGLAVGADGASTLQIRLDSGTLAAGLPAGVPRDRVSLLSSGWRWTHAGPAVAEVLRSIEAPSWVAMGRLLRIFAEGHRAPAVRPALSADSAPAWLAQVRDSLVDPASGVRLAAAARVARVHPVYLARMFRRHYGCSIGEMASRARLCLAARLLGKPDVPLADVAGEAGYSDQPHLCREFRSRIGVTPLEYRRVALDV